MILVNLGRLVKDWHWIGGLVIDWQIVSGLALDWQISQGLDWIGLVNLSWFGCDWIDLAVAKSSSVETLRSVPYSTLVPRSTTGLSSVLDLRLA